MVMFMEADTAFITRPTTAPTVSTVGSTGVTTEKLDFKR